MGLGNLSGSNRPYHATEKKEDTRNPVKVYYFRLHATRDMIDIDPTKILTLLMADLLSIYKLILIVVTKVCI